MWHRIQYECYHNCLGHYTPLCITSHPVYLWHHIQYVGYHHTAFMTKQRLYWTSHPPYLTSQPLYLCHHIDGTHICIDVSLYQWHHKCVSHHTWHTYDIIPIYITSHSHIMTSKIMFYDVTNTAFMTSDLLYMTSHPLFWTSHHFMYDIKSTVSDLTSTVSVSSQPPCRWHHSHYMDCITSRISVISYPCV